ncbi:arsenite methyltransferase [Halorussus amylolyticus]|uniref:arsenite methyltransferase n=1 Tax=Halorussus amylolyticus TaxID=1126242 RepID=UPI00104CD40F|nr:arsenite methyltransferase [Halorussus amylolyticus]
MTDDCCQPTDASTDTSTDTPTAREQRNAVRDRYGSIATESETLGGDCCEGDADTPETAEKLGYSADDIEAVAEGANLSLGCGNPTAIAELSEGETVVDLGSGGGFDCFLAAREVGESGRVVGVDMTPEMVERARDNTETNDADNVEFRLGEIEHLPMADGQADVIISNCVVNLSPDKPQVFAEAYRVLEPGGRIAITDVVLTAEIPTELRGDLDALSSCISGAARIEELEAMLDDAGFEAVEIEPKEDSEEFIREWTEDRDLSEYVVSARITARKPA